MSYPGIPYGSPMIDTYGMPPLRNPADGYAFPGGILPAPIPGENSTGKLRWKAAEPVECQVGSGLQAFYYGGGQVFPGGPERCQPGSGAVRSSGAHRHAHRSHRRFLALDAAGLSRRESERWMVPATATSSPSGGRDMSWPRRREHTS